MALTLLLAATLLAACGSGNARESRFYQEQEATRESQVASAQETTTARFFSGTPTAAPTATPQPVLSSLRVATSIGSNGEPLNQLRSASRNGTIYVSARIHDVTGGTVYAAVLGRPDGASIATSELTASRSATNAWFSFPFAINGTLPGGQYAAFVYTDGVLLGSIVFELY